jgi:hypothetical protein
LSPWLNPVEPQWTHTTREVVEPDRLLDARELARRACAALRCPYGPQLSLAEDPT